MRRYLVVANQPLLGGPLTARVRECLAAGPLPHHIRGTFELPMSVVVARAAA